MNGSAEWLTQHLYKLRPSKTYAVWATPRYPFKPYSNWYEKMTASLKEMSHILKPAGRIAQEVGEVRKGKLKLEEQIMLAGRAADLKAE